MHEGMMSSRKCPALNAPHGDAFGRDVAARSVSRHSSRGMQAGPSRVCSVLVAVVVVVVCTASVGARFEATLIAAWLRWSRLTCAFV